MIWMRYGKLYIFLGLVLTLTSCSSIRLAVYDYQKRHAGELEHTDVEIASASVSVAPEVRKASITKKAITDKASKYIGSRYRYGSCDPKNGFDCSGLVYHVAKSQQITLPRSSSSMASVGNHIPWKKAEPGDLIFFGDRGRINHVGIVEKNKGDQMWIIHSSSSSGVVSEDIMVSAYWKKRVMFAIDIAHLAPGVKNQRQSP